MRFLIALLVLTTSVLGQTKKIALTIDDLPIAQAGSDACQPENLSRWTDDLIQQFAKLPTVLFVIGDRCGEFDAARKNSLAKWQKAGAELGNHTFSHPSFSKVSFADYQADIEKARQVLDPISGKRRVRYFRSPYLHIGNTAEKKIALQQYLSSVKLQQSQVTVDNSDWTFANALVKAKASNDVPMQEKIGAAYLAFTSEVLDFYERRTQEVVGREISHILLLHSNAINAKYGRAVVELFQERGYRFVSLSEALKDPVYQLTDGYTGANGISWIHRWGLGKNMQIVWDPDPPKWLSDYVK
jgi:peptidoglycan-N-acetylglucosamine deacetylase